MNIYKISIIFCALILFSISCSEDKEKSPTAPTDEFIFKWLSTTGNKIVNEDGEQVILHGVNRSGLEYDQSGNRMRELEFEYICNSWYAKIVRIPFNQEWIMNDESYNNLLAEVIGWIKRYGAYVLLNLKWQNTVVQIPSIPDIQAIDMWKKIAMKYKDDPAVLYDIHSEAHDVSLNDWQARAIEIIDGIRSVHPRSLILVSGLDWAKDVSGWAKNPLPYDNIVYSVHIYPWMGDQDAWNANFGNYTDQIPMFIGEFGGYGENLTWGRSLIAYLNRKKLGWTAWSWVDDPHLTRNDRRTPTEFGNLVAEMLYRHAFLEQYANQIFDMKVEFITSNRATINWKTSNLSDSRVFYGLSSTYTDTLYAPINLRAHTIKLTDLQSNTTYHFKLMSIDEFGFTAESSDSTFVTMAQ